MAVLSKMLIEQIAEKMTVQSKKYYKSLYEEMTKVVTAVYVDTIPEEVKKCFKTYPDYVETTSSVYLDSHGFSRKSLSLTKQHPATSSYHVPLHLTAITADRIMKVMRKWEKAQEDYKTLVQETESALYALKTNKNIRENLPEAVPYLPPPMSNSLVVNFNSLQKKLNKQPVVAESVKV